MNFLTDNEINSMLVSNPNDVFDTFKVSYWIANKYFVKCAHCGYEIFVGHRHTAPRDCQKCGCKMIDAKEEK